MKQLLENYAELAIRIGLNLQQGQELLIQANIEVVDFVRIVVKKAYEVGAKNVDVLWHDDDALTRLRYEMADADTFKTYPLYKEVAINDVAKHKKAILTLEHINAELLEGIDASKIQNQARAKSSVLQPFYKALLSDEMVWCMLDVPSVAWAEIVFPDLPNEKAQLEALWHAVFTACRVDLDNPIKAWKEHLKRLKEKEDLLNQKKYKALHFKDANGTDLTIGLSDKHLWYGGGARIELSQPFCPNIPTEEIFTMPVKTGVNGIVKNTMPLAYLGNIIDGFTLEFKKGRIVNYTAEVGFEALKNLIETDEGSHYLGEVALVPFDTPISKQNLTYYSTLFDENGRVHLGLGEGSTTCLEDGSEMTAEELEAIGANNSLIRCCFVIGSDEMDIDGINKAGGIEPIFRKGCWV